MKRMALTVALLVFLSAFIATIGILPEARATTLYVGGGNPGNYTTIQGAIDEAMPGDAIHVYSGTYYENVRVKKTLSLTGEGRDTTIIDGGGTKTVVRLSADWVNITGFTLTNSDWFGSGIELHHAEDCYVASNNAVGNGYGISLEYSHSNTITNNTLSNNRKGIYLDYSNRNTLVANEVSSPHPLYAPFGEMGDGIKLYYSSNNTMANNNVSNNDYGISIRVSSNNTLVNNNIYSNSGRGISLHGADGNRIYHNNFMDNAEHPYDEPGDNQWDDGYPSGGNYWDDYTGIDEKSGPNQDRPGGDGMGDSPCDIQGGTGLDRYPLMSPIEPFEFPTETPSEQESILEQAWFWVVVALVIVVVAAVLLLLVRKRKQRREGNQTSETREPP
ncbi:MAG: right-handed parallel beta-helix repeat-containing protein [Thermoplasmata archaeon]|nr:right-handed parallel beta-helix repeat-containing protein [Thermoplasmata archaeon]